MYKPVIWMGRSKEAVSRFSQPTRRQAGFQLFRVQQGLLPTDWKPMSSVGPGTMEIRLHEPHEHRVIYVAKFGEAIYVLHSFEKKTQKTSKRDIDRARQAYKELIAQKKRSYL